MGAMEKDGKCKPDVLRVDGGLVANQFVCQFLSDMLNCPVEVPKNVETTALGAACLAGLGSGVFKNLEDIAAKWKRDRRYEPRIENSKRDETYSGWVRNISRIT